MLKTGFLGDVQHWVITILILTTFFINSSDVKAQQLQLLPSTKQLSAAFGYSISHSDIWLIACAKDDTTEFG